jgi:hypothetical protein
VSQEDAVKTHERENHNLDNYEAYIHRKLKHSADSCFTLNEREKKPSNEHTINKIHHFLYLLIPQDFLKLDPPFIVPPLNHFGFIFWIGFVVGVRVERQSTESLIVPSHCGLAVGGRSGKVEVLFDVVNEFLFHSSFSFWFVG